MNLIKAKTLGFCMGVRRAVDMAAQEAASSRKVYTIGPLIHNPQVMDNLREAGVEALDEKRLPERLDGAAVIIRAHGIPPCLEEELTRRGARLVDAACPKVKASQYRARAFAAEGRRIFLAGEREHAEIAGIRGYAGDCTIVADRNEARSAAERLFREAGPVKTALLGQTTLSIEEYRAIEEEIRRFFPELVTADTICGATRDRQEALRELCGQVEAVVIAGGRESANTRRLLSIAEGLGKRAWLVERAVEIPAEVFSFGVVGVSAGASTPDSIIEEIWAVLHDHCRKP